MRAPAASVRACVAALGLVAGCGVLEEVDPNLAPALEAFDGGRFEEAQRKFEAANAVDPTGEAAFGRGASLDRQGKPDLAAQAFKDALQSPDPALRARAFLDYGNALMKQQKAKEAVEAYKQSLALDPKDPLSRYNLEYALRALAQQQQEKKDSEENPDGGSEGEPQDGGGDDPGDSKDDDQDGKDGDPDQDKKDGAGKPGDQGEKDPSQQGKGGEGEGGEEEKQAENGTPKDDASKPKQGREELDEKGEPKPPDGSMAQGAPAKEDPSKQGKAAAAKPLTQAEADQILDTLESQEKSLQMWRFQTERPRPKVPPGGKDW